MNTLNFLFLYLKKRNIHLNKKEFIVQYESHPAFPSLLALSDTLRFFNVENGALHVKANEIDNLPSFFMAKLKHAQEDNLAFVELKNADHYTIHENTKTHTISRNSLLEKWLGIVFLIENTTHTPKKKTQFIGKHILLLACVFSFIGLFKEHFQSLPYFVLFFLPVVGCLLSVTALKDIFNFNNTLVDALCKNNTATDCQRVIHASDKFSILSDVSFVFFTYQLITCTISSATNTFHWFVGIQKIALLASIPVLLFSLYYQLITIKKICVICIAISAVILLELLYIFTLPAIVTFDQIPFSQYNFHLFSFLALALGWYYVKDILSANITLKQQQIQANRFKRNYTVFKNTLTTTSKIVATPTTLIFGNPEAKITMDFMTSPFCEFCKKPYSVLKKLLENHAEDIAVRCIYNVNQERLTDEQNSLVQHLYYINETHGQKRFFEAVDYWYETKDAEKWAHHYGEIFDATKIQKLLQVHRNWCITHKITFTPALFINGYLLSQPYTIEDLNFFIDDLIEDHFKT